MLNVFAQRADDLKNPLNDEIKKITRHLQ